jgi:hypothetical protein
MAGNVAEWVADWFQPNAFKTAPDVDPTGPESGSLRVVRSNGYDSDAIDASPTARFSASPRAHRPDLGFRCVVKDANYFAPFCRMPVFYGVDASTDGLSSKPCPDPIISHAEACMPDNKAVEFVTVRSFDPTTVTVTGLEACDPANNDVGVSHTCAPGLKIQVTASCDVTPGGNAACPPNFKQDPNNPMQCTSPGDVGACPTGFQYDSTLKCCSALPDNSAAIPLCAVGQHLFGGVCVNDFGGPLPPNSLTFTTGGLDCALPTTGAPALVPAPTAIIPFPTDQGPEPQPTPHPTNDNGGGHCDLKPRDCVFGVDRQTCTCRPSP